MADENFGDKTEAPTARRLEDARERGQVARSADLTGALMLLAAVGILYFSGRHLGGVLTEMLRQMLQVSDFSPLTTQSVMAQLLVAAKHFGLAMAPMLLGMTVMAVVANVLQGGFIFSTQPLSFSLDKIDPISGFGRIFSKRSLARLVSNLLKLTVIVWVGWAAFKSDYDRIVCLSGLTIPEIASVGADIVLGLSLKLAAILIFIAGFDYLYQRWQFMEDLKMTKQELREEMKRMEGDPLIKEQRRHIQREMAMHRMSREVPKADAIITNPTHFAIAIRYDTEKMAAPRVVAKGSDLMAKRMREIAMENHVPIVEKPALARALYKSVEVGQEIPVEFYKAVAEVLAFVYRLTNKSFKPAAA